MGSQRKGFSMCLISGKAENIKDRTITRGGEDEVRKKGLTIGGLVCCGYTHRYCFTSCVEIAIRITGVVCSGFLRKDS